MGDSANKDRADSLACLRILSRDPAFQTRLAEADIFTVFLEVGGLLRDGAYADSAAVEAMKCLSNVVFKNPGVVKQLLDNNCVERIVSRCEAQVIGKSNIEVLLYDLKVLFLCSALDSKARLYLLNTYFASDVFIDILKWMIESDFSAQPAMASSVIELLKMLFNLSYAKRELDYSQVRLFYPDTHPCLQNAYEATYRVLTQVVRCLLVKKMPSRDLRMDIANHAVNFLTSIPVSCNGELLFQPEDKSGKKEALHRNAQATRALAVLGDFLSNQLDLVSCTYHFVWERTSNYTLFIISGGCETRLLSSASYAHPYCDRHCLKIQSVYQEILQEKGKVIVIERKTLSRRLMHYNIILCLP